MPHRKKFGVKPPYEIRQVLCLILCAAYRVHFKGRRELCAAFSFGDGWYLEDQNSKLSVSPEDLDAVAQLMHSWIAHGHLQFDERTADRSALLRIVGDCSSSGRKKKKDDLLGMLYAIPPCDGDVKGAGLKINPRADLTGLLRAWPCSFVKLIRILVSSRHCGQTPDVSATADCSEVSSDGEGGEGEATQSLSLLASAIDPGLAAEVVVGAHILFRPLVTELSVLQRTTCCWQLAPMQGGVVLRFLATPVDDLPLPPLVGLAPDRPRTFSVLGGLRRLHRTLGLRFVADLNRAVRDQAMQDLVLVCEAVHENAFRDIVVTLLSLCVPFNTSPTESSAHADLAGTSELARHMLEPTNLVVPKTPMRLAPFPPPSVTLTAPEGTACSRRIVALAGPSSSGKTSVSHRLRLQFRSEGIRCVVLSMDDYYRDAADPALPHDDAGNPDYECLESLHFELLARRLAKLVQGDEIPSRHYSFLLKQGQDVADRTISLSPTDFVVVEGIHALNPRFTSLIAHETAPPWKIYVSAIPTISLDQHHQLSSSDCRLLRRILRDWKLRGYSAQQTLTRWPSVRKSEDIHLFPFQEEADYIVNSYLSYELVVIAGLVRPLLCEVPIPANGPATMEKDAARLEQILSLVYPAPGLQLPCASVLREFLADSVLPVS